MAASPQFGATPNVGRVALSAANTALDGTGTIVDLLTGATNGTVVSWLNVQAIGTTGAGFVRLFYGDGTNTDLLMEIPVGIITPSATQAAFSTKVALNPPIMLKSTHKLKVSTHLANTFRVVAFGGDL